MKISKVKKYEYGGKMDEEGQLIMVKAPTLDEAVKSVSAAVKASGKQPTHYKVKACFYEEEEE
jgi:hypothetical protein